jgi:ATP-dependent helicase YprA (DUF1998 family)
MNLFETHRNIISGYKSYINSFINIADEEIRSRVKEELEGNTLWPEPLIQFNPAFEKAGNVADLVQDGTLHPSLNKIFTGFSLYKHQAEGIRLGAAGKGFVVTSGTGSGKSLTFLGSIFNHLLRNPDAKGVQAVIIYPMNALINSQHGEIQKYADNWKEATGTEFPVTFAQYTGQEGSDQRKRSQENPPHIILPNNTQGMDTTRRFRMRKKVVGHLSHGGFREALRHCDGSMLGSPCL